MDVVGEGGAGDSAADDYAVYFMRNFMRNFMRRLRSFFCFFCGM